MPRDVGAGRVQLLQIASDDSEPEEMLAAAGEWLSRLAAAGAVSEFDLRDLTDHAAATFFTDS